MYKFAICDDDVVFCRKFEMLLSRIMEERHAEYSLACYNDGGSFAASIRAGEKYDLVFLDIMIKEDNGLELARTLRRKENVSDIVFVTDYDEYAVDSYDVEPLHYLIKSDNMEKLETAMIRFISKNSPCKICVSTANGLVFLPLCDIMCFEIYGHDIVIHLSNGTKQECRGTLKQIETLLPPESFIRLHRSYLVNLDFISEISHNNITLSDGMNIPLGKTMYKRLQIIMVNYLGKKNMFI